jgi:hypothetical protein
MGRVAQFFDAAQRRHFMRAAETDVASHERCIWQCRFKDLKESSVE